MVLSGKRVLLIIGGGIAAFKSIDLIRRLQERQAKVRVILTPAAREFVTPLTLGALTRDKVYTDLFNLTDEAEMGHIELSRDADLLVVAPATANLMGRMANGLADDLATTALLATDKPVLIAPAMNVRMWDHPATRRNLAQLTQDGILTVGPGHGDMACGEYGPGRMAEPLEIVATIEDHFRPQRLPLKGKQADVTAGPTHEPIDPVRYIANRSSGKQGYAIAASLARAGATVTLVSGPTNLPDPDGVRTIRIETARDMLRETEGALPADVAVLAAAVADWRTDSAADQKMKKVEGGGLPTLSLTENPDILATLGRRGPLRPQLLVGFAAETEKVLEHAEAKRLRKGCDWLVANDVSPATGVMGGDENTVHLLRAQGPESWPRLTKQEVADRLVAAIAEALAMPSSQDGGGQNQ